MLVVIGLLVGGVLVGRDLIKAAEVRSQVSQIEKLNQAVNTFRIKTGYLPGDIPDPYATQFGFMPRGTNPGQGDGNGVIQGYTSGAGVTSAAIVGETAMFWVDLSTANVISGGFNTATPNGNSVASSNPALLLPKAAIGQGNYIHVWSVQPDASQQSSMTGTNYFGVSVISNLSGIGQPGASSGLTVQQAYSIDTKIDDGFPQTGNIMAMDDGGACVWSTYYSNLYLCSVGPYGIPGYAGTAATCADNRGDPTSARLYSIEVNNGTGMNCSLSFKFQ